jgi:inorganic triphosphatase YgiF
MTAEPVEREIPFIVLDRGRVDQTLEHLVQGRRFQTERLVSVYYDTSVHTLSAAHLSLRLRQKSDGSIVQTVKGPRWSAEVPEYESEVLGDLRTLDYDHLRSVPLLNSLSLDFTLLEPVFKTVVSRNALNIVLDDSVIELAFDQGFVFRRSEKGFVEQPGGEIDDLELELKAGDPTHLNRLALRLLLGGGLRLQPQSKAKRGYGLIREEEPEAIHHHQAVLSETHSTQAAFRYLMIDAVKHLQDNLPALMTADVDGVHQGRIAIRRIRTVIQTFAPVLRPDSVKTLNRELRTFGRIFGIVRDYDVFLHQTLPQPPTPWSLLLQDIAETMRHPTREYLVKTLQEPAFNALVIGLLAWTDTSAVLASEADKPITKVAPDLLDALAMKVTDLSHGDVHPLRIAVKRLRYAMESFESLFPTKAVKGFLHACRLIQNDLGQITDRRQTRTLCQDEIINAFPSVAYAVEQLMLYLNDVAEPSPGKLLRKLNLLNPPWK